MLIAENRFIRSTHKDGKVRDDIPKLKLDECTWVVHMLHPDKKMTFSEVVECVHAYNKQENEPLQNINMIALGLVRLIEADMVRVIRYHKIE